MSAPTERFVFRIPKTNRKLLRWLELAKEQKRGYVSTILSYLLKNFLSTGEIMQIGTVDPQLCTLNKAYTITTSLQNADDPVFGDKLTNLRDQRKFNSVLTGLLERAIGESSDESLLSSWELDIQSLLLSNKSTLTFVQKNKPLETKTMQKKKKEPSTSNQKHKTLSQQEQSVVKPVQTMDLNVQKDVTPEPVSREPEPKVEPQAEFSFASSSSNGSRIRNLMSRSTGEE